MLCSDADMARTSQNEGIGRLDEAKELFEALEDAMNALVALPGILVEAYQRQNHHFPWQVGGGPGAAGGGRGL